MSINLTSRSQPSDQTILIAEAHFAVAHDYRQVYSLINLWSFDC
jgi:hypothetical protein